MFGAKNYNDVRNTIAAGNGILAAAVLISFYVLVLTPAHRQALATSLGRLKLDPLISPFLTLAMVGAIWGYLTTFMFSFHDRLYEPHFVSWRASYESDFILRCLCLPYCARVSPRLFEIAFTNKTARASFMQRLFYKFVKNFGSAFTPSSGTTGCSFSLKSTASDCSLPLQFIVFSRFP